MPSDKFLAYKEYVRILCKNSGKRKVEDIPSFDDWLHFEENEVGSESRINLELATALASGEGVRMPDVRAVSDVVLNDYAHQATAFLAALARSRIPRMAKMLAYCDRLEDKLMEQMDEDKLEPIEMIQAYRVLGASIAANTELVKYMLDYSRGTPVDPSREYDIVQFGDKVGDASFNAVLSDKHNRDKIRNAVQLLIKGATPRLLNGPGTAESVTVEKPNGKTKRQ